MFLKHDTVVRILRRGGAVRPFFSVMAVTSAVCVSLLTSASQISATADTSLQAEGLPLKTILQRSKLVFIGRARSITTEETSLTTSAVVLTKIRVTTFSDVEFLRPQREPLGALTLRQYDAGWAAGPGERVLWFVEDHIHNLKGPVGGQSGHFTITTTADAVCAPARECDVAENLAKNKGLFGTEPIWTRFNERDTRSKLEQMRVPRDRIEHLIRMGTSPRPSGPIPLDLLRALIS